MKNRKKTRRKALNPQKETIEAVHPNLIEQADSSTQSVGEKVDNKTVLLLVLEFVPMALAIASIIIEIIVFKQESIPFIIVTITSYRFLLSLLITPHYKTMIMEDPDILQQNKEQFSNHLLLVIVEAAFSCAATVFWLLKLNLFFFMTCSVSLLLLILVTIEGSRYYSLEKGILLKASDLIQVGILLLLTVLFVNTIQNDSLKTVVLAIFASISGGLLTLIGVIMTIKKEQDNHFEKQAKEADEKLQELETALNELEKAQETQAAKMRFLMEFPDFSVIDNKDINNSISNTLFHISVFSPECKPNEENTIYLIIHNDCIYCPFELIVDDGKEVKHIELQRKIASNKTMLCISSSYFYPSQEGKKIWLCIQIKSFTGITHNFNTRAKYLLSYYEDGLIHDILSPEDYEESQEPQD